MPHDKIGEVVVRLHRKALEGGLKWMRSKSSEDYTMDFPKSTIWIGWEGRRGYEVETVLKIYNSAGILVHEVDSENIALHVDGGTSKLLEEIHAAARESILKTNQTIDDILGSL